MTKLFAWLAAAMLVVVCATQPASAGDPLKPYVLLVLDTSGSMACTSAGCGNPTGSGPPSCGGIDNKLNHAKCAINNIVNAYGDMVFAFGRFRTTMGGTTTTQTFPGGCCEAGPGIGGTNGCTAGPTCNLTNSTTGNLLQMMTALVDGNNQAAAAFVNFAGNSCTTGGTDPEIWDQPNGCTGGGGADGTCGGATPLEGVLRGAKRYYQGLQATDNTILWQPTDPGFDPIRTDPLAANFLPPPNKAKCEPNPGICNTNALTCSDAATCGQAGQPQCCCCIEQCRPYVVILLTDGAETCGGNPSTGADALIRTDVTFGTNTRRYRIETKPIGFGIAPGDAQIEAIAHAGGQPDDNNPATFEGSYASDEASLQLAISNILDDAIRTESCNNLDDDCDTLVDEDFPTKGGTCNNGLLGVCRVNGTQVCRLDGSNTQCNAGFAACAGPDGITGTGDDRPPGSACTVTNTAGASVPGTCQNNACQVIIPPQSAEVCNNLDDDCDGKVDENLTMCSCVPKGEQCNGMDDDCDGTIDEGITKPCGTGVCVGTQTCVVGGTGVFGPCLDSMGNPVQTPSTEVCNGVDDNCDGIVDGLSAACSDMVPFPTNDNPQNNPGHVSRNPIPENACKPGNKTCPVGSGAFGQCQGELKPCGSTAQSLPQPVPKTMGGPASCDGCNGIDDDCDNVIDEDFQPADCSSTCGIGQTKCMNGQIMCNALPAGSDETCNNIDDNCNGMVDEGFVGGPCGAGVLCNGVEKCQNGVVVCDGQPIGQETCNCADDNCNGVPDDGVVCGAGSQCKFCQCAMPCAQDEFPCPMGKFCKVDPQSMQGFCIADPCFGIVCPARNGEKMVCKPTANADDYTCEKACDFANCGAGEVCIKATGECKPDNCHTFPNYCTADELCIAGVCKKDLCKNVSCMSGQYCVQGICYGSCANVTCPDGQKCAMGTCVDDPCGHQCPFGQVCIESEKKCEPDPCAQIPCPTGQWCNPQTVMCEDDPCNGTTCPGAGQVCKGGTCFDAEDLLPDAPEEQHVTTGGGGGCNAGAGAGLGLVFALLAITRRRRARGGRS